MIMAILIKNIQLELAYQFRGLVHYHHSRCMVVLIELEQMLRAPSCSSDRETVYNMDF